jgi:hypothetical protein
MGIVSSIQIETFIHSFFWTQSCGSTPEHCDGQPGGGSNGISITREQYDCIFDQLDPVLRDKRWQGRYTLRNLKFSNKKIETQAQFHPSPFFITFIQYILQFLI